MNDHPSCALRPKCGDPHSPCHAQARAGFGPRLSERAHGCIGALRQHLRRVCAQRDAIVTRWGAEMRSQRAGAGAGPACRIQCCLDYILFAILGPRIVEYNADDHGPPHRPLIHSQRSAPTLRCACNFEHIAALLLASPAAARLDHKVDDWGADEHAHRSEEICEERRHHLVDDGGHLRQRTQSLPLCACRCAGVFRWQLGPKL